MLVNPKPCIGLGFRVARHDFIAYVCLVCGESCCGCCEGVDDETPSFGRAYES